VSSVPTDPVQPASGLARPANPQAGTQSSGETSPFEALLSTGSAPASPTPSKPVQLFGVPATGQSPQPAAGANHLRGVPTAPGAQSPSPPTHGSNGGSNDRASSNHGSDPQVHVHADGTIVTSAKLPIQTLTDQAGASATGEPPTVGRDNLSPGDPMPAAPARKSDKTALKATDDSTVALPAPAPIRSAAQQAAGTTIIAATAVAAPAPAAPAASAREPSWEAPLGGAAPIPTLPTPEPGDLPLDPIAPDGRQGSVSGPATGPRAPKSLGAEANGSTAAPADVPDAGPTPAPESVLTASPGTIGEPAPTDTTGVLAASAAAPAANAANHANAEVAASAHIDPTGGGPASPAAAAGPSGSVLAQSATPPVAANLPLHPAPALLTAAPVSAPPLSPAAVPISGLAVEIAARVTRDEKSFQIRLDPPELGRIDVQLNVDASGHVTTHLTADRPETLDLLRQDASSLQRALESTGLKADSGGLEFSLRDQSFNGHGGGQSNGTAASVARIVVSDEDLPPGQTVTRGYARLSGLGTGVDIRV
jgi:flagellar hook-length control protein FliK